MSKYLKILLAYTLLSYYGNAKGQKIIEHYDNANDIEVLTKDFNKGIWVGTSNGKVLNFTHFGELISTVRLSSIVNTNQNNYKVMNLNGYNNVTGIACADEFVFVSDIGYLYMLKNDKWEVYFKENDSRFQNGSSFKVIQSNCGEVFLYFKVNLNGYFHPIIYKWVKDDFIEIKFNDEQQKNYGTINNVFTDSNNFTWFCFSNAIVIQENEKWNFNFNSELINEFKESSRFPNQVIEDSSKNIWLYNTVKIYNLKNYSKNNVKVEKINFCSQNEKDLFSLKMFINIQNQIDFLGTKNIYHIIDNCIVKKSDSIVNPFSDSTQNLLLKYKNIMKLDSSYLLSTNFGLMVFKDNKWKDCSISNSIDNYVNNIFIDNKKNIWAFTGNPSEQTLTKISSPTWEKFSSKNLPIIFSGQKIIQDNNENIWIADDNIFDYTKNLLKISIKGELNEDFKKSNTNYKDSYKIHSLFVDSKNNIWVGNNGKLMKYNQKSWISSKRLLDIPEYSYSNLFVSQLGVFHITEDKMGIIYGSTYGGLLKYDGLSFKILTTKNSNLPSNNIWKVFVDNYNKLILISDFENEMILYKEFQSKWVKIFMPEPNDYNPSGHNPIFVQNSKRDLFLCQRKNIYKLVDDKWILDLDLNNTLLNCELNCFSIVDDTYWIGTNLGLFRIIKTYNKSNCLAPEGSDIGKRF